MTIKEFIEKHNGNFDAIEIKHYAPIGRKISVADYVMDQAIDKNRVIATYNSPVIELLREIAGINLYTDLEVKSETEYSFLEENGLLEPLIETIGKDYYEFRRIFDMRKQDYIREANDIDGVLARLIESLNSLIGNIDVDTVMKFLEAMDKK